jgi:hypothetical protein
MLFSESKQPNLFDATNKRLMRFTQEQAVHLVPQA